MKIKKISEDKVQIIITNQDLEERDFKKWELLPVSPKAQELFQDLLDMAYEECGFEIEDDSQLMVEAYPVSVDSFAVVMTKIRSSHAGENISVFSSIQNQIDEEALKMKRGLQQTWVLSDLETCCQLSSRIVPDYAETSSLYKYHDQYYLNLTMIPEVQVELTALLGEYGEWVPYSEVFLKEYASQIISREAIVNLASLIK